MAQLFDLLAHLKWAGPCVTDHFDTDSHTKHAHLPA
jgi:hypothetical protein